MFSTRTLKSSTAALATGVAAVALSAAVIVPAQAQSKPPELKLPDLAQVNGAPPPGGMPQAVVVQPRPIRFIAGIGVTGGGDRLATARYRNYYYYEDRDIRAGQLLQIHGGIEWRVAPAVTMQATIGYHGDSVDGWNGDIDFTRYPLELLAHYQFAPMWRVGGGLRYTINPRLDGWSIDRSGVARDLDVKFKRSLGPVIEVEFLVARWVGIKLRGAFERYKPRGGGPTADGNHIGLFGNFYF